MRAKFQDAILKNAGMVSVCRRWSNESGKRQENRKMVDLGSRSIEKNIKKLKDYGLLIRHGFPKNGHWEVTGGGSKKWQD